MTLKEKKKDIKRERERRPESNFLCSFLFFFYFFEGERVMVIHTYITTILHGSLSSSGNPNGVNVLTGPRQVVETTRPERKTFERTVCVRPSVERFTTGRFRPFLFLIFFYFRYFYYFYLNK